MKVVIQRVRSARVEVAGAPVGEIGLGLLLLAGIERGDAEADMGIAARKITQLRMFGDDAGKMNLSVGEVGGSILAVSQFTLAGSIVRGRRPSFDNAEEPEAARRLFETFLGELGRSGVPVKSGKFREMMLVTLENDGPVTFVYES